MNQKEQINTPEKEAHEQSKNKLFDTHVPAILCGERSSRGFLWRSRRRQRGKFFDCFHYRSWKKEARERERERTTRQESRKVNDQQYEKQ
jgi:hypothetical protein